MIRCVKILFLSACYSIGKSLLILRSCCAGDCFLYYDIPLTMDISSMIGALIAMGISTGFSNIITNIGI